MPTHRRKSVLVALMFLGPATGAGCVDEGAPSLWSLAPSLAFAEEHVDVGTLFSGHGRTVRLLVENRGGAPAHIEAAAVLDPSGPAVGSARLGERVVPSGGDVVVELRLTAAASSTGLFAASVVVTHDAGQELVLPVWAQVMPPPACDDGNPCTLDSFDGAGCRALEVADGSTCDDDDVCTVDTVCQAGACVGALMACDDGVDCTLDSCDSQLGCRAEPLPERCDDGDACSDDVCTPLGAPTTPGCTNPTSPDGTVCQQDGCASLGLCFAGSCHVSEVPDGFPCDDGDPCSFGESCQAGLCGGGAAGTMGGAPPIPVAEGGFPLDPCLGLGGGCGAFALGTFDELLTAYEAGDGRLAVVWKSGHLSTHTGQTCVPHAEQLALDTILRNVDIDEPLPPAGAIGNDNGADAEAPPPEQGAALPDLCAAGVFVTVLEGAASTTTQVSSTDGPAAATFFEMAGGDPVLALVTSDGDTLRYGEQDLDDTLDSFWEREVWLWRSAYTVEGGRTPIRRVAVDAHADRVVVVGHPAIRQSSICSALCDAPSCCDTYLEGWDILGTNVDPVPSADSTGWTLYVPEQYDASCQPFDVGFSTGHAFDSRDLSVRLDEGSSDLEVTALMNPWPCADAPGGATDPQSSSAPLEPYRFERSAAAGGFIGNTPILPPELDGAGVLHLHSSQFGEPLTAVVPAPACPDALPATPINPDEGLTCGATIAHLAVPAPVPALVATFGTLPDGAGPVDALPLAIGDLRPVAGRASGGIDIRWHSGDGLEIRSPPGLAEGWTWRMDRPFVASQSHVVGITEVVVDTTGEDCCPAPSCDCACDGDPDCDCACAALPCTCAPVSGTVPRLTAQPFTCVPAAALEVGVP